MRHLLLYPMAVYVFYIFALAMYNFRVRFNAVKSGQMSHKYFKTKSGETPTERVLVVGCHYDNQFQLPMLFFITCVFMYNLRSVGTATVTLAWLFVATRFVHSYFQLGPYKLRFRVLSFAAGWLCVLGLWIQILMYQ